MPDFRDIYRKTLKRIPFIRAFVVYALSFTPAVYRLRNDILLRVKRHSLYAIVSPIQTDTLEKVLFPLSELHIPPTPCFDAKGLNKHISKETFHFPATAIYRFANSTVHAKSHFLTHENYIITHQLSSIPHDLFNEELNGDLLIDAPHKTGCWRKLPQQRSFAKAAVFTDAWSHNYAHFITEVLTRIAAFCSQKEYADIPLLIDADLHQNCMQAIRSIAGEQRTLHLLPRHETAKVADTYYTDYFGYIPFESRGSSRRHDGIFSKEGIACLATSVPSHDFPQLHKPSKIFLRRNSGLRNIANIHEVEKCFVENGFTVIEPEKLSFLEQVAIMRCAKVVAGATGAAMANLVFCAPGTQVIVLLGQHPDMPYGYWRGLAAAAQCELTYVFGHINGVLKSFHNDYTISRGAISAALHTKKAAQG